MDPTDEPRLDPEFAGRLLLEIAQEPSLDKLLQTLARRILEQPPVARVKVWLLEKSDRCLHVVTDACKAPVEGEGEARPPADDPFARVPLGVGVVGRVASSGQQVLLQGLDRDPGEFGEDGWLRAARVRVFKGIPISFKGEVLGVTGIFARRDPPKGADVWGRVFAGYVGAAIAHARAFEEIRKLKAQLEQQNAYLREEVIEAKAFGALIGQSPALRQIVAQIDMVAPTDASVLVFGETGTGKELVAHEIHRRSQRAARPLIRVNCASVPKELFESEFFGHVKGAFTGAIRDRAGRFEAADGGTLFLDEIGEVPLDLQAKLLRVLQEKRYERVGEDRTRMADVRIVGATNRDLKKEVAEGRFREDLYYRLCVFPVHVAPLRDRREDIPLLARHFVDLSIKELRSRKPRLTPAGVARLQAYDWPGNVRELRNVIDRAVILARGGPLEFDLPSDNAAPEPIPAPEKGDGDEPGFLTETEMRLRERENLLAVLKKSEWRVKGAGGAAELLGLKPTTLISRIKKLGLKRTA